MKSKLGNEPTLVIKVWQLLKIIIVSNSLFLFIVITDELHDAR